jgi:peptidoglycan biosynthesis protein MviN/MurJ (putative lipid II flippase)
MENNTKKPAIFWLVNVSITIIGAFLIWTTFMEAEIPAGLIAFLLSALAGSTTGVYLASVQRREDQNPGSRKMLIAKLCLLHAAVLITILTTGLRIEFLRDFIINLFPLIAGMVIGMMHVVIREVNRLRR